MKEYTDEELALIAIDSLDGFEYKYKAAFVREFPLDKMFRLSETEKHRMGEIVGDRVKNTLLLALTKSYAENRVRELNDKNVTAILFSDPQYPKRLRELPLFPLVLYCRGRIELLNAEKSFSIVGSRKTLPYATAMATDIAERISKVGVTVVTGSASGGDRAALLGAMASGNVITVLAHGHNFAYPEANRELIKKVESVGLSISEFPPHIQPRAWLFPVRNRIIAGLSQGVLIISGEMSSGVRHTMNFALDYGREVFAFPYSVGIKSGEICNDAIKNGATLCDRIDDIFSFLELGEDEKDSFFALSLDENELAVYNTISDGAEDARSIEAATGLKIYELAPALSSLEIEGLIVKMIGNKYKKVR